MHQKPIKRISKWINHHVLFTSNVFHWKFLWNMRHFIIIIDLDVRAIRASESRQYLEFCVTFCFFFFSFTIFFLFKLLLFFSVLNIYLRFQVYVCECVGVCMGATSMRVDTCVSVFGRTHMIEWLSFKKKIYSISRWRKMRWVRCFCLKFCHLILLLTENGQSFEFRNISWTWCNIKTKLFHFKFIQR